MKKIIVFLFAIFGLTCLSGIGVSASTLDAVNAYLTQVQFNNYFSQDDSPTSTTFAGIESMDEASGGLTIVKTDLELPGKGGHNVVLTRRFNSSMPMNDSGNVYGISVGSKLSVNEQHDSYKYLFKYYVEGTNNQEVVYIAYDTIADMLDAEAGTNTITISSEYVEHGYQIGINDNYGIGISNNNIGITTSDTFYLYSTIPEGNDVTLLRDLSLGYAELDLWSIYSYEYKCNTYKYDYIMAGGWIYDIPKLNLVYRARIASYDYWKEYAQVNLFTEPETGRTLYVFLDYEINSDSGKVRVWDERIGYYEEDSSEMTYINTYDVELEWNWDDEDALLTITNDNGTKYLFDVTNIYRMKLLSSTDKFGNTITYDSRKIIDSVGRVIEFTGDSITVNGQVLLNIEEIKENNNIVDPDDIFYVDDTYSLKVSYATDGMDDGSATYNYRIGNYKWYTSDEEYRPFVSTNDADHFVMDSIELSTGAKTEYGYTYVTDDLKDTCGEREYLKLVSRKEVDNNIEKNETIYTYESTDDDYDTITTIRYSDRPNYVLIKKYDEEGNLSQQVEENTDEGNKYYIVTDYTYEMSKTGSYVPTKIVTNTKTDENGEGNTVTLEYEYDTHDNVVKTTRDGVVIQISSYNSKNLLSQSLNRKDDNYYVGIKNTISSDGLKITKSSAAQKRESGTTADTYEGVSYRYSDYGDISRTVSGGVTTNMEYSYTDYDDTNPTADYLTVTSTVTSVPTINGADDETITQDIVTSVTYDYLGRLVSQTDAKGNTTRYEYDNRGNVIKQTNPDETFVTKEYDYINNVVITTDETGRKTKSEYDGFGHFKKGYLYNGNEWKKLIENTYDSSNNLVNSKLFNDDGDSVGEVQYSYYSDNKVSCELVVEDYDVVGKKEYKYYPYYADNEVVTETKVHTSEEDYAIINQYSDKYGYKTKDTVVFDNNIYTQSYTTDYLGNVTSLKDFKANSEDSNTDTVSYKYDYANRVIEETNSDGTITNTYSTSTGLLTSTEDREGTETSYFYDRMGRLSKEESDIKKIEFYYDANGNQAQVRNYLDNLTYAKRKSVYNSRNLLTDSIMDTQFKSTLSTAGNLSDESVVKYEYDDSGRIVRVAEGLETSEEAINPSVHRVTEYEYDAYGNVSGETDSMGGVTRYVYNLLGLLVEKTDKNGTITSYTYDVNGNLMNQSYTKLNGETDSISYTYDMVGNVTSMIDNIGITLYNYDSVGNILSEITDNYEKTYTYDANGNVITFVLTVDDEQQQNLTYTYDDLSRVKKITDGNNSVEYTYDSNGNILREYSRIGSSIKKKVEYTYTDANLPKTKTVTTGSDYEKYTMTYDWLGNTKTVTTKIKDSVASTLTETDTTYAYDGAGRLLSETNSDGTGITYAYDKYNNMTSKTAGTNNVSYVYDKNNKLTSAIETGADTTDYHNYFYDNNGNLISKTTSVDNGQAGVSTINTYVYDGWNRLTDANVGETVASYRYRGNNLREEKTVTDADGTKNIFFVYNGMDIVYDDDGISHNNYVRGLEGIAYRTDSNDILNYFRTNQHGDVTSITSTAGTVNQSYKYDAYGNLNNQSGTDENPFQYCSEYYDEETGFYYLRNRFYDPSIGRFISEDPIKDGMNWYAYAGNNPIMFVDPLGLAFYVSKQNLPLFQEYVSDIFGTAVTFEMSKDNKIVGLNYDSNSINNDLDKGPNVGVALINALVKDDAVIRISFGSELSSTTNSNVYVQHTDDKAFVQCNLIHELVHAYTYVMGYDGVLNIGIMPHNGSLNRSEVVSGYREATAITIEEMFREYMGYGKRDSKTHGGFESGYAFWPDKAVRDIDSRYYGAYSLRYRDVLDLKTENIYKDILIKGGYYGK